MNWVMKNRNKICKYKIKQNTLIVYVMNCVPSLLSIKWQTIVTSQITNNVQVNLFHTLFALKTEV